MDRMEVQGTTEYRQDNYAFPILEGTPGAAKGLFTLNFFNVADSFRLS
jgi:hypothetical protein